MKISGVANAVVMMAVAGVFSMGSGTKTLYAQAATVNAQAAAWDDDS